VRDVENFAHALRRRRNGDGGFGPRAGQASEPEPTALAALALEDEGARAWLADHQGADGGFELGVGSVVNDAATGLAAIAIGPGSPRERALDHLERRRAESIPSSPDIPHDPSVLGWGWTEDNFGWVEPTARAVLAFRLLRPDASPFLVDGVDLLRDREAVGGGWNYGNRIVLGEELPPYVQTTAIALVALRGLDPALEARGLAVLANRWRGERDGGLTLAQTVVALRLYDHPDAAEAGRNLADLFATTEFLGDTVSLAWAAIAAGPAWATLGEVTP
jgi:hypothetical protein